MERKIELPSSEPSNFDTADCLIYDTLAFSFGHRQDYIVSSAKEAGLGKSL